MIPSPATSYSLAASISLAALAPAAWSFARASSRDAAESARLSRLQSNAATLSTARASLPDWAARSLSSSRPQTQEALASRLSAALGSVGLPASSLANLSVQSDPEGAAIASTLRIHRRRATLVLSHVTLPRLGAFLQTWRTSEPDWIPSSIDAAPEPATHADAPPAPGADLPLRVVIAFESLSVQPISQAGAPR
jgi:hypothetical protein